MNLKRLMIVTLIMLIILSSFSIVTAGWFDSLDESTNDLKSTLELTRLGAEEGSIETNENGIGEITLELNLNLTKETKKGVYEDNGVQRYDTKFFDEDNVTMEIYDKEGELIDSRTIYIDQDTPDDKLQEEYFKNGLYRDNILSLSYSFDAPDSMKEGDYLFKLYCPGGENLTEFEWNKTIHINKANPTEEDYATTVVDSIEGENETARWSTDIYADGHTETNINYY